MMKYLLRLLLTMLLVLVSFSQSVYAVDGRVPVQVDWELTGDFVPEGYRLYEINDQDITKLKEFSGGDLRGIIFWMAFPPGQHEFFMQAFRDEETMTTASFTFDYVPTDTTFRIISVSVGKHITDHPEVQ